VTIFDLLFLVALLASVVTLVTASVIAVRGSGRLALKILLVYGICALLYLAAGVAAACWKPQRVLAQGAPWCFDDWCLTSS
jgi:hypothetical protein